MFAELTMIVVSTAVKPALRETSADTCLQSGVTARCKEQFGVHAAGIVLRPAGFGARVCESRLRCRKRENRRDGGERQSFRSQFCLRHPTASSSQASVLDGGPKASDGH
jgi:hypothetical protein